MIPAMWSKAEKGNPQSLRDSSFEKGALGQGLHLHLRSTATGRDVDIAPYVW